MKAPNLAHRLMRSSALCAIGLAAVSAGAVHAQTATEDPTASQIDDVVVTGSRIPSKNLTSVSPVTTVGAEDIQIQGVTRVEDLVNSLPQAFAAQGATIGNGSTGTATVDLRGLGSVRTLVLIDGRRLHIGTPAAPAAATAPDLNFIPAPLIEKVEIVTGGASAVYGADAVAGVVNFIMKKDFDGFRFDAQTSFYQHQNDSEIAAEAIRRRAAGANNPAEFTVPDENVVDGATHEATLVWGANTPDGLGNVTAYASYRQAEAVSQRDRDFGACTLNYSATAPNGFSCGGSGTTAPAGFITGGGAGDDYVTLDPNAPGGRGFRNYVGARDAFNFGPFNYFQRPDERYTLGAFAHYQVAPKVEAYGQLMFMDDVSSYEAAPSGIFGQTVNINCDSPQLSASQAGVLCNPTIDQRPDVADIPGTIGLNTDADPFTPGQQAAVTILRRNVEGGARQANYRHTSYRAVGGVKGEINDNWSYDVSAQYGSVIYSQLYLNDFSISRFNRALDVVTDPSSGQAACRSRVTGVDPNCVPYDIFRIGGVTQAAIDYISTPGMQSGEYTQSILSANLAGELGVTSPLATSPLAVSVGTEYRREFLNLQTDTGFSTGDLAGQGGATPSSSGSYDLWEVFGELRAPLIEDRPFARSVTAEFGYRYSDYSLGFDTSTYKIGGDWEPIDGLRFRGSFNHAVRAPNIVELFSTSFVGLNGSTDPCEGPTPEYTAAQCARTGVTAAQYGRIAPNIAGQYNGRLGGNENLMPETSDTISYGVVYRPSFLSGFSVSLDYYNITVEDRIGAIGQDNTLRRCAETGDAFLCGLIRRAPGTGSLWLGTDGFVIDQTQNTGELEVEGLDLEANYRVDLADLGVTGAGSVSLNYVGSYLDSYEVTTLKGDEPFDCAGYYGTICTGAGTTATAPLTKYRHKTRATWQTPWAVQLTGTWRYVGEVSVDSPYSGASHGQGPDAVLEAEHYFDLAGTWDATDFLTFRFGINNLFDNDPPLVGSGAGSISNCPTGPCNGNTYPQTYDAAGRYVFFGLTADF